LEISTNAITKSET